MTDPVTAAARRQHLLDALVAELVGWGCPDDYALPRARRLLDVVTDHGWSLPAALLDAPPHRGPGSTDAGRAAARRAFEAAERSRRRAHETTAAAMGELDAAERIVQGIVDRSRVAGDPQHTQERPAATPGSRLPGTPVLSRHRGAQQDACRWAHGHVVLELLDEHGLCPICAADEVQ